MKRIGGGCMKFITAKETAQKWGISERSVRHYCAEGRIEGAVLIGKTWSIPDTAKKPERTNKSISESRLLERLKAEKREGISGGIYHKIQIELTYNSNHIEGSKLSHDQTRYIFETNTIGITDKSVKIDDIIETVAHFRCIDKIIDSAKKPLTEKLIKELHRTLKSGTSDSEKPWFNVGEYKGVPNEVGGMSTTEPENVAAEMNALLKKYNLTKQKSLADIIDFHVQFERIHPFQDGNGRIGRLIMLKECLKHGIVPFIIEDEIKMFYYRGLKEWDREKGYLTDTCLSAQDKFKAWLDYFRIPYDEAK